MYICFWNYRMKKNFGLVKIKQCLDLENLKNNLDLEI